MTCPDILIVMQSLYNYGPLIRAPSLEQGEGPHRESEIVLGMWHMISSPVTSSRDNNSVQPKYHRDHQRSAQFEFMTLIINKASYGGRILREQMKNTLPFWDHFSFHSAHVSCAQNVTQLIGINEAGIHHFVSQSQTPWADGSRRIRAPSGSNLCRVIGKTAQKKGRVVASYEWIILQQCRKQKPLFIDTTNVKRRANFNWLVLNQFSLQFAIISLLCAQTELACDSLLITLCTVYTNNSISSTHRYKHRIEPRLKGKMFLRNHDTTDWRSQ